MRTIRGNDVIDVMRVVDPAATYSNRELAEGFEVAPWRMSCTLAYLLRRGRVVRLRRGHAGRASLWKLP